MFKERPEIERAFRDRGLRCTPQRYAVLEFLMRDPVHATAEQIYHAVNLSCPRASRATVYNNLHALRRAGLVREVALEGKAVRFDSNIDRHHHFLCERCGRVEDIEWFDVPHLSRHTALGPRIVQEYELILRGICETCVKN